MMESCCLSSGRKGCSFTSDHQCFLQRVSAERDQKGSASGLVGRPGEQWSKPLFGSFWYRPGDEYSTQMLLLLPCHAQAGSNTHTYGGPSIWNCEFLYWAVSEDSSPFTDVSIGIFGGTETILFVTFDKEKGLGKGEYLKLVCPAPQLILNLFMKIFSCTPFSPLQGLFHNLLQHLASG